MRRLVPLAQAGDRDAAASLVASVTPFALAQAQRHAARLGGGAVGREDLVSVGLAAALLSIRYYRPVWGRCWKNYAMTFVARKIHRAAKDEARRFRATADADGCAAPPPGATSPERTTQGWSVVRVRNALARLDPAVADLVRRVYGIDQHPRRTPREAAEEVGLDGGRVTELIRGFGFTGKIPPAKKGVTGWQAKRLVSLALAAIRTHLR